MSNSRPTNDADAPTSAHELLSDPRVVTLSATSFAGTLGGGLVAPALPAMATALAVSDARIGLVMTAYSLAGLFTLPILSIIADTYGRRSLFLLVLAGFGATGVAIAAVGSFGQVLALRLVQGVFGGMIISLSITILGDLYTGPQGTTAQGIRLSANGLSRIVVPIAAGFFAGIAWQTPFLGYAFALVVAGIAFVTVPETVDPSPRTNDPLAELRSYLRRIADEITNRRLGLLALGGFFQGAGWLAILTFVPVFAVRVLGATTFEAGLVLSIVGVLRIGISPHTGRLLTLVTRRTVLIVGLAFSAGGAALVPLAPSIEWLGVIVGVFGVGDALFTPVHRDTLTALARDTTRAGTIGATSVLRRVGTSASPVVFGGVLAVAGFGPLFWGAGAVFGVYALGLGVWFRKRL